MYQQCSLSKQDIRASEFKSALMSAMTKIYPSVIVKARSKSIMEKNKTVAHHLSEDKWEGMNEHSKKSLLRYARLCFKSELTHIEQLEAMHKYEANNVLCVYIDDIPTSIIEKIASEVK